VTESRCADVAVRLSAWIDGELDASTAAGVREHLAVCVSCQRRHALLAAAGRAVRSLPEETVSAGFEDAFRRRLDAARTGAGRRRGRSLALVAAAVLMLVVLKPLALRRTSSPVTAPTESSMGVPRWLATCAAPTAGDCQRDTPCASASACGVVALDGLSARQAPGATVPAGAPCASASTCRIVSVVPTASAGRFSQPRPPASGRPR
jgi:anti-sigma factor RsiW